MAIFLFKCLIFAFPFSLCNFLELFQYQKKMLTGKGIMKIYNLVCILMKFAGKREKIEKYRNEIKKMLSKEFVLLFCVLVKERNLF